MAAAVLAAALVIPTQTSPIPLFGSTDGPGPSAYIGRYY